MLTQDYLNLGLVRLRPAEQWRGKGEGLYFVFPRAGTGLCLKAAARLPLAPGDVLVTPADPAAQVAPADGAEFAFWHFSLRLEHLYPLFAGSEISLLRAIIDDLKASRFYPASSTLAVECHKLIADIPPQFNLDHRGQLIRLAAAILNNEFKTARGRRTGFVRAEDHLIQVFEKLSAEEILNHSVEQLAKRFGCSRRHLSRLFHHYFGYSVGALRMEMRLLKAISLLRDHDAKIIHVAEQCGFNHLGLFNTCFRKRFGTSPGQWRKAASRQPDNTTKRDPDSLNYPLETKALCPWRGNGDAKARLDAKSFRPNQDSILCRGSPSKAKLTSAQSFPNLSISLTAAQDAGRSLALQLRGGSRQE